MKKIIQHKQPQAAPQETVESKKPVQETSPSVDVNNEPVSENDNSPNLFEEHIRGSVNNSGTPCS
jgi:hypothetical protein